MKNVLALRSLSVGRVGGIVLVASALAPASSGQDRVVKLSGTPPFEITGSASQSQITRDGTLVVYRASEDVDGDHLYSVPIKGGTATRLTGPIEPYLAQYAIDPRGLFVVYRAGYHVFSVPIDGSAAPLQLDQTPGEVFTDFQIDPSGEWVVFVANGELQSVPIAGGDPIAHHSVLDSWNPHFQTTPGGEIVYIADEVDLLTAPALYTVAIDGSTQPRRLSGPLFEGQGVQSFVLDAQAGIAVFQADLIQNQKFELFSVPVDGSREPFRISGPLAAFANIEEYAINAQGTRVVYRADRDLSNVVELYGVPAASVAAPVKLNVPLDGASDVGREFRITADGMRVVHTLFRNGVTELHVTAIDASSGPTRLDLPDANVARFWISPDDLWVIYRDRESSTQHALFRVPIHGRTPAVLLSAPGQDVKGSTDSDFAISADSARVVYRVETFYSARLDGGAAPVALAPTPVGGVVGRLVLDRQGERALYISEQERFDVPELYSVPVDASEAPIKLNGPITAGYVSGDVGSLDVSADGKLALFSFHIDYQDADGGADQVLVVPLEIGAVPLPLFDPGSFSVDDLGESPQLNQDASFAVFSFGSEEGEDFDLFTVASDGSETPLQLNPEESSFDARGALLTPDGTRVVFTQEQSGIGQVFSAPIDGSGPTVQLSSITGPAEGAVRYAIGLSPDGSRVVYAANLALPGMEYELFSVPVDGSSEPVQLNDVEWPRGYPFWQYGPLFSADGTRVVYSIDQDTDEVFELYSVPADGSATPQRLNAPFAPDRDVLDGYQVAGTRALFVADQGSNDVFELYSVPIDGSSLPIALSGTLTAGGDVKAGFGIVPDGTRVVYVADADSDEKFELFVVPVDGSAEPLELNGALVAGGDVELPGSANPLDVPFVISPDGARVVYLADQDEDGMSELFSVPIDRSTEPIQISGALVAGGDVLRDFQIAPDGREVFYVADQLEDGVFELFRSRIGLGGTSLRVNGPLVAGGDVLNNSSRPFFAVTSDSTRVLYAADQELDQVRELYMAILAPRRPAAALPARGIPVRVR